MSDLPDPKRPAVAGMIVAGLGTLIVVPLSIIDIQFILLGIPFGAGAMVLTGTGLSRARDIRQHRRLARVGIAVSFLPFITAAIATALWGVTR